MLNSIYNKWKTNKPLLLGLILFLAVVVFVLVQTIYSAVNLQKVQGKILSVKLDQQKHTYLTLRLAGDNRIYYQEYEKRFYDADALNLHQNDDVSFFTFKDPEKKSAAISSL